MQTAAPFFTNDPIGYIRVVFAFVMGMSPILGLVVWFLRKGPGDVIRAHKEQTDREILSVRADLNSLGEKVGRMDQELSEDRKVVAALGREITEGQREMIASVHRVELVVARLEERGDVGQAITQAFEVFGDRVIDAHDRREKLEQRERERGAAERHMR